MSAPTDDDALLEDALRAPKTAIFYALGRRLAAANPGSYVLETSSGSFDVENFAFRGHATLEKRAVPRAQIETGWRGVGKGLTQHIVTAASRVTWEGIAFDVVTAAYTDEFRHQVRHWVIGPDRAATERFLNAVFEHSNVLYGEVLVFAEGCWSRSSELYQAIRNATFDNLVLVPGLAEEIRRDFRQFLASRAEYEKYGAPWKRGVIFLGPPGNGKTHCIKALLNELDVDCLYVQSFVAQHSSAQSNIRQVFDKARKHTPCVLVLEDLDSLITDRTRSFFLNELDGFATNTGIVTLATTNHPERLDPAILERPSRFDRKYHFELPGEGERLAYAALWKRNASDAVALDDDALLDLTRRTDGFSFAYVKELFLSSLVRWVSEGRERPFADVARTQVDALRAQMESQSSEADVKHTDVAGPRFPRYFPSYDSDDEIE